MKHLPKLRVMIAALLLVCGSVTTALANEYNVGAQLCVPVNLDQAASFEFAEKGVTNKHPNYEHWLMCPVAVQTYGDNADIVARITNDSNVTSTALCHYKLISITGDIIRTVTQQAPVPPGFSVSLVTSNIDYMPTTALVISCKLPPGFRAVSFSIETQS
jgi:hypothetical protein